MKAARFYAPRDVRVEDVERPAPGRGELLIEVLSSNMCGTDLKTFARGHPLVKPGTTMGHEYSGVVRGVGEGLDFKAGDRVVGSNSCPCGRCEMCKRGSYTLCTEIKEALVGFSVDGSYARHLRIPAGISRENTYRFVNAKPEEAACAEPLAAAIHALDLARVRRGETVAVVGSGALGLMFLQLLKGEGAKVIMTNRSEGRLELAERLGADEVIRVSDENLEGSVKKSTAGLGADVVIEAVGRRETWEAAFKATRDGGRVIEFGGCAGGTVVSFDAGKVHYGETAIIGAFHHEPTAFRRAVEAIESGKVNAAPLVTHRLKLEEILDGFELMEKREALKVAIVP